MHYTRGLSGYCASSGIGVARQTPKNGDAAFFTRRPSIKVETTPSAWRGRPGSEIHVKSDAELVAEEEVLPAFVTSISERGLVLDSLAILANRSRDRLQIRLTLPGEPDALWIAAEVVRDDRGLLFNDIAIRFLAMANSHWRALRRWVRVRELVLQTRPIGAHDAA